MAEEAAGIVQIVMKLTPLALLVSVAVLPILGAAQPPPPPSSQQPGPPPACRAGRRGGIPVMTLTSSAWADGGMIPLKYTQAGDDISPPLAWSDVPQNLVSFVLI